MKKRWGTIEPLRGVFIRNSEEMGTNNVSNSSSNVPTCAEEVLRNKLDSRLTNIRRDELENDTFRLWISRTEVAERINTEICQAIPN